MRPQDVRIAEGYRVQVPQRLPRSRYPPTEIGWPWALRMIGLQGRYFEATVVEVTETVLGPTAEVQWVSNRHQVELDLSLDQVIALGLPAAGHYRVRGYLTDDEGRGVKLPEVETMLVPVRWLHPLTDPEPAWPSLPLDRFR
ncbi:hypothetical protein GCM10027589_04350 [Actinocorallia lasiicapitis]